MKSHRTASIVALYLAATAFAAPTRASAGVGAESVDQSPPPPRVEKVEPRDGYVWAPGYWEWNRVSYHWVTGRYIFQRRRYHWVADQWEHAGGHWHYVRGRWDRVETPARLVSSAETPGAAR